MFRIDSRSLTSYAAAISIALMSTVMIFAATSTPSVEALTGSVA